MLKITTFCPICGKKIDVCACTQMDQIQEIIDGHDMMYENTREGEKAFHTDIYNQVILLSDLLESEKYSDKEDKPKSHEIKNALKKSKKLENTSFDYI